MHPPLIVLKSQFNVDIICSIQLSTIRVCTCLFLFQFNRAGKRFNIKHNILLQYTIYTRMFTKYVSLHVY